jgi:hypothetical protein
MRLSSEHLQLSYSVNKDSLNCIKHQQQTINNKLFFSKEHPYRHASEIEIFP